MTTAGESRLRLGRSARFRNPKDFRRVMQSGSRAISQHFVVVASLPHPEGGIPTSRLGITASRKVGNAVARNRVKRWIREWFRAERAELARPADLVVIARRSATTLGAVETRRELHRLAWKAARGLDRA